MEDSISGGTVHFNTVGEGTPIVMLHGGPGDLLYMKGLMEPIFQEHSNWQRLYLDLPGCGFTKTDETIKSYDDVLEFVLEFIAQQLPDRRFALAGHSYGGYLARGVIHRWPNRVSGLCLITPRIVQDLEKKIVPEHATLFAEPGFRECLTPGEEWMTDYLVVQTKEGLEAMRRYFLPGLERYDEAHSNRMKSIRPGLSFDVDELESPFESPTLIITGRQDRATGYQDAWGLLDKYPRATFVVLDKAGHFLGLVEQKKLFRSLVMEWLDRMIAEA
jgi:pimeloyl-ACP methyl ester carboxylesterase